MNASKVKQLLQRHMAVWQVFALLVLGAALMVRGCSSEQTRYEVPEPFRGTWEPEDLMYLRKVRISARAVVFTYEDKVERCVPEEIKVHRHWASDRRSMWLTCSRKHLPQRARECATKRGYTTKWILVLRAESGSDFHGLEGADYQHPCYDETRDLPLLWRAR